MPARRARLRPGQPSIPTAVGGDRMSTGHRRSAALGVLTAVSLALAATTAGAAGFAIFEQGARGMGFAGAFTAQTTDPSAIFHNAAGIAFLKGKHFYFGGALIAP